jgi:nuclear cap-binding protein subunit 1
MGEILRIPSPAHPTVYYGCMMIELCKLQSTLHPALGAAINYLFEKIPYMQAECADRLADWLSFHLSNLDFKWLWSDWAKVVDLPPWALQRRWVARVLERCLRLAYLQRITSVLKTERAEALITLLPEDQTAVFPMGAEDHPLKTVAEQVCDMVSLAQRQSAEALQEFVSSSLSDLPSEHPSAERTKILVAAMVYEGRESFSHVLGILGRYLPVLRASIESDEEQCAAAEAVAQVWSRSHFMCFMVMDKMVAMKLISPLTLVRWLLSDYERCRQQSDVVRPSYLPPTFLSAARPCR